VSFVPITFSSSLDSFFFDSSFTEFLELLFPDFLVDFLTGSSSSDSSSSTSLSEDESEETETSSSSVSSSFKLSHSSSSSS
jgi:hypothetical protein